MRVLRVFTPGNRPNETGVCRAAFRYLADTCPYSFAERETLGDYGYRAALEEQWRFDGDLCILEQDLIPTPTMLAALAECPHQLCAQAYSLSAKTLGREGCEIAHRVCVPCAEVPQWIVPGGESADLVGFGLTKLGRAARARVTPEWQSPLYHHTNLDTKISFLFLAQGMKFHIHWPEVAHFHA